MIQIFFTKFFRGVVMIGMILVDNQAGIDADILAPFRESGKD